MTLNARGAFVFGMNSTTAPEVTIDSSASFTWGFCATAVALVHRAASRSTRSKS